MSENKKYPPSYYRYHHMHKSLTLTFDNKEYDKIIAYYGGTAEIKKVLLNMASENPVNIEVSNELTILREKYDKLLKINKILIDKLKNIE